MQSSDFAMSPYERVINRVWISATELTIKIMLDLYILRTRMKMRLLCPAKFLQYEKSHFQLDVAN